MTPETWEAIQDKLNAALKMKGQERAVFLAELSAEDSEVGRELESLIAAHERAHEEFLHGDEALANLSQALVSRLAGRRLGNYRILEQLGSGGMGEVYRAVRADDQYQKQVAIKLVRTGQDSGFVISRFKNERQILANLDHPNIARLLDGGTTAEGVPYFVMELVEGEPIDQYCDKQRLPTTERLHLFSQVCSAVQYAHQHLIVHRDIKPGNVLVTVDGAPKLLDFGIAKIVDVESGHDNCQPTVTAFRALTPAYASPEQVKGEPITTSSDVYSLGVVLYELLTGHTPYRGSKRTPQEMTRAVCETEPEKPSTVVTRTEAGEGVPDQPVITPVSVSAVRDGSPEKLMKRLDGDLDNIVLMALRKEPQRRYASVEQFREDIRRHLEHLPVIARRDTVAYRTSKFIARHKAGVAAGLIVAIALLGGMGATLWEAHIARIERTRAERRFNDVRELANSLIFDVHDSIQNLVGATQARKVIVDKALHYLDGLSQESSGDPSLQRELASAYERLGDVQGAPHAASLGESASAQRSYSKSIDLLENLLRSGAAKESDRLQLSGVHDKLSVLLSVDGDLRRIAEHEQRAADLAAVVAQANGPNVENALVKLIRAYVGLGDIYWDMNMGYAALGDPLAALPYYQKAEAADAELIRRRPNDRTALFRKAALYEKFARVQMMTGHRKEAMVDLQHALAIVSSEDALYHDYNSERHVRVIDSIIGDLLVLDGRFAESLPYYRQQLQINEKHAMRDPSNADALRGEPYRNVGYSLARSGQPLQGLHLIEKAIAMDERLVARDPAFLPARGDLANDHVKKADVIQRMGRNAGALEQYEKAGELYALMASGNKQDIEAQLNFSATDVKVAALQLQTGRVDDASEGFHRAIESSEKLSALSSEQVRYTLSEGYAGMGDVAAHFAAREETQDKQAAGWGEAQSWYEKSLAVWNKLTMPGVVSPKGFVACDPNQIRSRLKHSESMLAKLGRVIVR